MTLYLTDQTSVQDIIEANNSGELNCFPMLTIKITSSICEGIVFGAKLYPAGATTNSDMGVTTIEKIKDVLQAICIILLKLA